VDAAEFKYDPKDFPDPHQGREYDESQLRCLLELTPLQRLENNERWRAFVLRYRGAIYRQHEHDSGPDQKAP
jgi:hypothetical protein